MEKLKNSKIYKFISNYKIAIILGVIMASYSASTPTDYTDEVEVINKEISIAEDKIEEKENSFKGEVDKVIAEKIQSINVEIEKITPQIDILKDEKDKLQDQYDVKVEKLKKAKRKAKEEREKKEEQARLEEAERKKGKWILESNGYNVWEAYFTPGTYQVTVKHKGNRYGGGNVIVFVGDRNNQEQILVINKIGVGTFAGTFKVATKGYYTLTYETGGSFTSEYKPF